MASTRAERRGFQPRKPPAPTPTPPLPLHATLPPILRAPRRGRLYMGGCLYRALLRPTKATVERFRAPALAVLDPAIDVVAVHVRTGDPSMHGREKLTFDAETWKNKYWECAAWREADLRNTSNGARPVKFLFVTDSLDYKLAAAEHFGDKLLTTDTVPIHIAKMQARWFRPHACVWCLGGDWVCWSALCARAIYSFARSRTKRGHPGAPLPLRAAADVGRHALEGRAAGPYRCVPVCVRVRVFVCVRERT